MSWQQILGVFAVKILNDKDGLLMGCGSGIRGWVPGLKRGVELELDSDLELGKLDHDKHGAGGKTQAPIPA